MAYKKYIKRNGKLYGPYIYESKRVDGKVISQYKGSGKNKTNKKKILTISLSAFFILAIFLWGTFFSFRLTGQVTGEFEQYFVGEDISGKFNLIMHPGELIPANTKVNITTSKQEYEFKLNDLVQKDPSISNYYLQEEKINGSGEGYGFLGTKETIEPVFFKLQIYPTENETTEEQTGDESTENETIENETIEEPTTNLTEEQTKNETIKNETTEEPTTNLTEEQTGDESTENKTTEETTESQIEESSTEDTTTQTITSDTEKTDAETESETTQKTNIESETDSQKITKETTEENKDSSKTQTEKSSEKSTEEKTDSKTKDSTEEKPTSSITGNIISSFLSGMSNFFLTITGNVIEDETIQADVSKGEIFTYSLPENTKAKIVPGSVQTQTTKLNESQINLTQNENEITITTNYSIKESGFGEEYYTEDEKNLTLDFTKTELNLTQEQKITIELIYENQIIFEQSAQIIPNKTKEENINETIPDLAEEIFNKTNQTTNQTKLIPENLTINITQAEKKILENYFNTITVVTKAKTYKDKIIIDFSLGNYTKSNAYDASLSKENLEKLIERDRTLWLKDIANRISYTKTQSEQLPNLSSIEIIN